MLENVNDGFYILGIIFTVAGSFIFLLSGGFYWFPALAGCTIKYLFKKTTKHLVRQ